MSTSFWNPFWLKNTTNDSTVFPPNVDNAILTENGKEARLLVFCFLSTFAPFSSHVGRLKARMCVSGMAWRCLLCAGFSALLLSSLLTHYNSEHYRCHKERSFNICCQIDGCTKTYSKVNSFAKHVRAVHRQFLSCTSPNDTEGEPILFEGMCTYYFTQSPWFHIIHCTENDYLVN